MSHSKEESKVEPINPSNHLKPDTIWHTAPRDDPVQEYEERYPAKKRRVSCGIEIVKCNICGYHFDSPAQLSDHLLHHDADYRFNPIYKCSYGQCMFRTDDRPLMKHHISRVHLKSDQALISKKYRNRKFLRPTILCSTCPMVFATEAELWQHTPNCKEYRCQFCGQHFWTIEKRYSHELAYHEDEFEYEDEEEEDVKLEEGGEEIGEEIVETVNSTETMKSTETEIFEETAKSTETVSSAELVENTETVNFEETESSSKGVQNAEIRTYARRSEVEKSSKKEEVQSTTEEKSEDTEETETEQVENVAETETETVPDTETETSPESKVETEKIQAESEVDKVKISNETQSQKENENSENVREVGDGS